MVLNKELIDEAFNQARGYYYPDSWIKVSSFFGEEVAENFDYLYKFNYEEAYEKGDLKECEAFYHLALLQKCVMSLIFDIEENAEAMPSFVYLQYWSYKLFDKSTGVEKHLWLN